MIVLRSCLREETDKREKHVWKVTNPNFVKCTAFVYWTWNPEVFFVSPGTQWSSTPLFFSSATYFSELHHGTVTYPLKIRNNTKNTVPWVPWTKTTHPLSLQLLCVDFWNLNVHGYSDHLYKHWQTQQFRERFHEKGKPYKQTPFKHNSAVASHNAWNSKMSYFTTSCIMSTWHTWFSSTCNITLCREKRTSMYRTHAPKYGRSVISLKPHRPPKRCTPIRNVPLVPISEKNGAGNRKLY